MAAHDHPDTGQACHQDPHGLGGSLEENKINTAASNMPDLLPSQYHYSNNNNSLAAASTASELSTTSHGLEVDPLLKLTESSTSKLHNTDMILTSRYPADLAASASNTKLPPPSHLKEAIVKEEESIKSDLEEKAPKRRDKTKDGTKTTTILKPDPKYKGTIEGL